MAGAEGTLDLRALDLAPGSEARLAVRVPQVGLRLGGEEYRVEPAEPEVELRVSRSLSGVHLRLRTGVDLVGPCWRCLEEARVHLEVESDEFAAEGRPADAPFDEDLDSAYVEGPRLDVAGWARDAIAEAVPATILCREGCAGLCPTCGADRNRVHCGCVVVESDPRWDALRELSERLGRSDP
ncbi:MAG TPA: DUF177 domain-containing protein [Miltoncostaeaceae bacterium]|jgi:uncharacterized protein|nr:DUF177 domain-containing protein [Miltoncostaeaceae bacterium]